MLGISRPQWSPGIGTPSGIQHCCLVVRARTPDEPGAAFRCAVLLTAPRCAAVEFIDADNGTVRIPPGAEDAVEKRAWRYRLGDPANPTNRGRCDELLRASTRPAGRLSATPGASRKPRLHQFGTAAIDDVRRSSTMIIESGVATGKHGRVAPSAFWRAHGVTSGGVARISE